MTGSGRFSLSRGFSLTELLVAMVIGVVLLAGLVTLMVNSKKNYSQQDYSARLQENARFAIDFLSYDIRMAGFYGCSNEIVNDSAGAVIPISATDSGNGSPDSLTITYGEPYESGQEVLLTAAADADATTLDLSDVPADWTAGDTLLVGDCGSNAVADVTAVDAANDQVTVSPRDGSFGRVFNPAAEDSGDIVVRRLVINTYAIVPEGASGIPVLARNGRELVEGVENIQLLYQSLAGGNFVNGSGSLPSHLAAVQLGALVRSVSNESFDDREYGSGADITVDDGQYTLLNQNVSAVTDAIRGQRRVFNSTFAVRNRPL